MRSTPSVSMNRWIASIPKGRRHAIGPDDMARYDLLVAKLGFGDGEILPDTVAFGRVAAGQPLQCIHDGTRALRSRDNARRGREDGVRPVNHIPSREPGPQSQDRPAA